jgi:hypothetical protein
MSGWITSKSQHHTQQYATPFPPTISRLVTGQICVIPTFSCCRFVYCREQLFLGLINRCNHLWRLTQSRGEQKVASRFRYGNVTSNFIEEFSDTWLQCKDYGINIFGRYFPCFLEIRFIWGVDILIRVFLISALAGGEWSASRSCHVIPWERAPRYPLDGRLGGPQYQSGRYGEVNIFDPTITI